MNTNGSLSSGPNRIAGRLGITSTVCGINQREPCESLSPIQWGGLQPWFVKASQRLAVCIVVTAEGTFVEDK